MRPDEAASLTARLATPDAFSKAGLQYKEALSAVQMAVEERNGRYVVKLSSSRPINEPFVDLMVELSWAAGKFVREYTFLLDPPVQRNSSQQASRANAPVVGAAASAAATASVGQQGASAVRTIDPVTGRLVSPDTQRPAAAPAPSRQPRSTAQQPARTTGSQPAAGGSASGGSVVVGEGETLGIIAARVRPASATLEQTIVAIYRNNPNAFIQNNPNLIRQGRTLDIPSEGEIVSVDSAEATRQLRVAARDFRSYKERLAAVPVEVGNNAAGTTASGSVSAKVDDQGGKSADVDRLELSRSDDARDKSASAVGARDAEALVAREAALKEANSRIAELERNVNDLQRMLELKNKSLADLQKQLEQSRAAGASVSGAVAAAGTAAADKAKAAAEKAAADKAAAEQAAADKLAAEKAAAEAKAREAADKLAAEKAAAEKAAADKLAAEKAAADKAAAEASAKAEAEARAAADKLKAGEADAKAAAEKATAAAKAEVEKVTTEADKAAAEPAKPVAPAVQKPADEAAADEQPGMLEGLAQSPMVLPVLGVFAVIAGLGYMVLRRRRRDEDGFGDSIGADEFTANSLFGTTGGQNVDTMTGGTTQITTISESTPTEVDPIAEAEVYIAYGRETQAEEILREALKRQPERQAIRLKLLEIFSGRKDTVAFSQMAREMHEMTGGLNEEWPRVASMGAALDPDNALYSDGSQPSAPTAPDAFGAMGGAAAVAAGVAAAQSMGAAAPMPVADEAPVAEPAQAPAEDMGLAFDPGLDQSLADLDAEAGAQQDAQDVAFPATRSGPLAAMPSVELPSLDLDAPLDLDEGPSTVTDLNVDTSIEDSLSIQGEPTDSADDVDLGSIGLDLSPSTISGPITMSGAASSQWQEMASKLDLASAYTEIGDKEGARELLEEVLNGGDAVQQQRAREMLADL